MEKQLVKKFLVAGVIILFIGAGVIPSVGSLVLEHNRYGKGGSYSVNLNDGSIIFVDDDQDADWYDHTHVRTIREGIINASDHWTVFVYNGTYYENLLINKSLRLIGENNVNTIIDGGKISDVITIKTGVDETNVIGFTVRNGSVIDENNCGIKIESYVEKTLISNNNIDECRTGIFIKGRFTEHNIISNNNIVNFDYCGIKLGNFAHNNQIVSNIISMEDLEDNKSKGIYLLNSGENLISQNFISRCYICIHLYGSRASTIMNNEISSCGKYGICTSSTGIGNFIILNKFDDFCGTNRGDKRPATFRVGNFGDIYSYQIYLANDWPDYDGSGFYRIYGKFGSWNLEWFTVDVLPEISS